MEMKKRNIKWVVLFFAVLLAACSTTSTISEPLTMPQTDNAPTEKVTANEAETVSSETENKKAVTYIMSENGILYERNKFFGGNILGVIIIVEEDY